MRQAWLRCGYIQKAVTAMDLGWRPWLQSCCIVQQHIAILLSKVPTVRFRQQLLLACELQMVMLQEEALCLTPYPLCYLHCITAGDCKMAPPAAGAPERMGAIPVVLRAAPQRRLRVHALACSQACSSVLSRVCSMYCVGQLRVRHLQRTAPGLPVDTCR